MSEQVSEQVNEEEKEAIKYLEFLSNEECECEACQRAKKEYKTILNLLDKQQKEIEELHKEINQRIKLKIENEKCVDRDFIYKGKIREKIKDYTEKAKYPLVNSQSRREYTFGLKALIELLEEK